MVLASMWEVKAGRLGVQNQQHLYLDHLDIAFL